jgi:hypothetical protein
MAYQISNTLDIHSLASDAKLVLSNPTEEWTLKNNFVDNKVVLETQTLPNILNVDPTTGAIDLVDTIRSTQTKLKSNTGFNTNLLSSLGMASDYDVIFPPTPPTSNQILLFNGVNYVWDPNIISTLASDGTDTSLVSNGTGHNLVIHSLVGTGGTSVTLVGNTVEINSVPPSSSTSPAFIAYHTQDLTDYTGAPYVPVKWNSISQTSTDVTYNSTTDVFTTVTTGDYMVSFAFFGGQGDISYLAAIRNETTLLNYVQDLSYPVVFFTQTIYTLRNGDPPIAYTWNDAGGKASFSIVVHLNSGDLFTLGIEQDPSTIFGLGDGALKFGTDDRPLTNCAIKRLL